VNLSTKHLSTDGSVNAPEVFTYSLKRHVPPPSCRTLTIDDEENRAGADPATWRILPTEACIKDDAVE
jgi:hypothetical protein